MDTKKVALATLGIAGIVGLGYVFYFDYKRRNDPEFRKKLKKDRKRAAKAKKAKEEDAKIKLATFAREALDSISEADFPQTVEGKEKYFREQVAKGESLFGTGEAGYQAAAICFYKALKVYPSPLELILIYQKTIPEAVFNIVYTMMTIELVKRQEEYWEIFPPREMNVKIQPVDEKNSKDKEKEKVVRRGVFATKDSEEGDVIYVETPIVSALDPSLEGSDFCSYCLREIQSTPIRDDEDLFGTVYCSEACRKTAREEYSTILFSSPSTTGNESRLVNLVKASNTKYPLMIARFLARMVYEETQRVATGSEEEHEYLTFDHVERLRYLEVPLSQKETHEIELIRKLLASKVPGIEEFITEERYMTLKGRLLYNAYGINTVQHYGGTFKVNSEETIRSSDAPVTGAGFYRVTSYLIHSCDPNTRVTFPEHNHVLSLVATKRIRAGDELNVSYIRLDGNRDTANRRKELAEKWRFACSCTRCTLDDRELSPADDDDDETWVDGDVVGEKNAL